MSRALLFPGQGSQYIGMGKSLAEAYSEARDTFEEVNDALSQNLSKVMWDGDEDALRLTENTQPALMAHSIAIIRILASNGHTVADISSHVAGHSLGEYSALCAAGSLSLSDAAKLLKIRGQAMQRAVPVGEGAMAAILGLELDDLIAITAEAAGDEICVAANDNAPGQVVISGHKAAVERAIELAKERGARRGLLLPVSAPFHCPLMQPAADEMGDALADVALNVPSVPVIANVTAAPTSDPDTIRGLLVDQVTGSVRWRESALSMTGLGIDSAVEIGAGKVLCGMMRRINRDLAMRNMQDPQDIDDFLSTL